MHLSADADSLLFKSDPLQRLGKGFLPRVLPRVTSTRK